MNPSWWDYGLGIGGFGVALCFAGWLLWTQDRRITTLIDRLTAWSAAPDGGGWCRRCGAITGNDAPHQPWCPTQPPPYRKENDDGA